MNKEFVPYEQALALKELGFDEPCFAMYFSGMLKERCYCKNSEFTEPHQIIFISAPLYQQAFSWFREKCRLQPSVNSFCFEEYSFVIMGSRNEILYPIQHKLLNDGKKNPWEFDTYEEAELACLIKLIEIVKEK
jgi:hypothetical protein